MHRRLVSILLAGSAVSVLAGAAIALGNSVSTTPAPAFVRSVESPSPGGPVTARADGSTTTTGAGHEGEHGGDGGFDADPSTTTSTTTLTAPAPAMTPPPAPGDDPATHDVGDDHGNDATTIDDPAGGATTSATVLAGSGGHDDPATHDLGDDHGGSGGSGGGHGSGPGSGDG